MILCACLGLLELASAEPGPAGAPVFEFADAGQARDILTARDDFIRRLSPFDRAARVKSAGNVSEEDFLQFLSTNALEWTAGEKEIVGAALAGLAPSVEALSLSWPKPVYLVKTTGEEEGGAAYTRGAAIVLPRGRITAASGLQRVLGHELFHVLSRSQPRLREAAYGGIGFHPCREIALPSRLKDVRITNPDGVKHDHCIRVQVDGRSVWAIPILYSRDLSYDASRGREFFHYVHFRFLIVERAATGSPPVAVYDDAQPQLADPDAVTGFFEQVGRNTRYIIHPDEILAENFELLLRGETNVASPEILERLQKTLAEFGGRQETESANP